MCTTPYWGCDVGKTDGPPSFILSCPSIVLLGRSREATEGLVKRSFGEPQTPTVFIGRFGLTPPPAAISEFPLLSRSHP